MRAAAGTAGKRAAVEQGGGGAAQAAVAFGAMRRAVARAAVAQVEAEAEELTAQLAKILDSIRSHSGADALAAAASAAAAAARRAAALAAVPALLPPSLWRGDAGGLGGPPIRGPSADPAAAEAGTLSFWTSQLVAVAVMLSARPPSHPAQQAAVLFVRCAFDSVFWGFGRKFRSPRGLTAGCAAGSSERRAVAPRRRRRSTRRRLGWSCR